MAKGAKKRRAIRKKQEKALLHVQASFPSVKVESCPLEENKEDVFSPKTPVQASEGEDKDRMFDMVGGSASPSSHTDEVAISKGVEYKSGSFEKLGFHELSASKTEDVGGSEGLEKVSERSRPSPVLCKGSGMNPHGKFKDWGIFPSIDDRHRSLKLQHEEAEKGDSFDLCEAGVVEANNQFKDETMDKSINILEGMHTESGSIENLVFHDFSLSQTNDVTPSQGLRDVSEGCSFPPSEGSESLNNCGERESAMVGKGGVNWLSEDQNGYGKDIILHNSESGAVGGNPSKDEIGHKDREMLEGVHYENRPIESSGPRDISVSQAGALTFSERLMPHQFLVSEADDPRLSERLSMTVEKTEPTTSFEEGFSMRPSPGVMRFTSSGRLDPAILGGNEGLGLPSEHNEHVKDISLDKLEQDDAETSKQLKDELGDFYRFSQSTNGSIEKLGTGKSPAYKAHDISLSERLEIGPSELEGFQLMQEQDGHEEEADLNNFESGVLEMLQSGDYYKSDGAAAPQMLQNAIEVNSSIYNSPWEFCMTSEEVCLSSSQALFDRRNPEKMGSTMALEYEDPQLLHKESRDGQDLCLDSSEHISVEVINQVKEETVGNVNMQGTVTNMLKEDPFFEGLVVSFPATEPSVDTANPLVPADLEPSESSGVVLQVAQVTLKQNSKNDNGRDFRDIGEEHTLETHSLQYNGEGKDIHAKSTLPRELDRGCKAIDMVLQSKVKLGSSWSFWGLLEFLLCWRD